MKHISPGIVALFLPVLLAWLALCACNGAPLPQERQPGPSRASGASDARAPHLRVMSYNVLQYGGRCQGDNHTMHGYLKQIAAYAQPDILALLKVASIPGEAPLQFPDSILAFALNASPDAHFAACPFSNHAGGKDINLLFYNKAKLGYAGMQTLVSDVTDFNLFKLYYKAGVAGRDTPFLYVLLLHTESGDKSADRDRQLLAVRRQLGERFKALPPLIVLGDFNLRNTSEKGYAALTQASDTNYQLSDPPFAPDKALQYPADWEADPEPYAKYFTTSTRKKEDEPNDCGTGGGAKSWYDHMLLSPSIIHGGSGFRYVRNSFAVIGNDGARTGQSVVSKHHPNRSVPPDVAEALYQFSNKYPVMLQLSFSR